MSIFDIFKPRASGGAIGDDERRMIFWHLKRKSSYTLWKAYADAFDRFADVVERQVNEEPVAVPPGATPEWGTHWEDNYIDVMKGQVYFEQGLERLLQGDRSVWLYNDRGVLVDALDIAGHWFMAIVNHGMRGDQTYDGKYVPEMTQALLAMSAFSEATAGIAEGQMADTPASEFWFPEWVAYNAEKVPFPADPGEVPAPTQALAVRTGDNVPVYGIYEPSIAGGCMNYLLADTPAPQVQVFISDDDGSEYRSTTWKLVWEDTRYVDGLIPAEEKRYVVDKPSAIAAPVAGGDDMLSAMSGQPCPRKGVWAAADDLAARQAFKVGDILPQNAGRDTVWVWSGD